MMFLLDEEYNFADQYKTLESIEILLERSFDIRIYEKYMLLTKLRA